MSENDRGVGGLRVLWARARCHDTTWRACSRGCLSQAGAVPTPCESGGRAQARQIGWMGRAGLGESDLQGGEGAGEAGAGGSRARVGGRGAAGSRGHGDGALLAQAIGGTREAWRALMRAARAG